jgi:hypothetical protein
VTEIDEVIRRLRAVEASAPSFGVRTGKILRR